MKKPIYLLLAFFGVLFGTATDYQLQPPVGVWPWGGSSDSSGKILVLGNPWGDGNSRVDVWARDPTTVIPVATTATQGLLSAADKLRFNRFQVVRATTDGSGNYTWTFPTAFANGTRPIIQVTPEDTSGGTTIFNHKIVELTDTYVKISVTRATPVNVLTVTVLGVSSAGATTVHLTASPP